MLETPWKNVPLQIVVVPILDYYRIGIWLEDHIARDIAHVKIKGEIALRPILMDFYHFSVKNYLKMLSLHVQLLKLSVGRFAKI